MAARLMEMQVHIASLYGFLGWSGEDWPQPHPVLGVARWNWDTLETELSKT